MAIEAIFGREGAGKSYFAVNYLMRDFLTTSARHIYTNLPLLRVNKEDPESEFVLVTQITRNVALRKILMSRIHILDDFTEVPLGRDGKPLNYLPLDEKGRVIEGAEAVELGPKNQLREFWYFTCANAVVFLDEVADIFPTENRDRRPKDTGSYLRHHRHYKDDLYFFYQEPADIDPLLRRRTGKLWYLQNSKKLNIFRGVWWLNGLRWPVQFFWVRSFVGSSMIGKDDEAIDKKPPEDSFKVWAWGSGFKTYASFSEAGKLKGKEAAKDSDRSSDFQPGLWPAMKGLVANATSVLLVLGGIVGACAGVWWAYGHATSALKASSAVGGKPEKQARAGESDQKRAVEGMGLVELGINGDFIQVATNKVDHQEGESFVMATGSYVKTNKRKYVKGDEIGGGVLRLILLDGVVLEDGSGRSWNVLFPGKPGGAGRGGSSDSRSL